ncbi:MAG: hypothetical protein M3P32_06375 [Chloroflexota bacterium]|nr:hypothetical protein [Chloroflexota bacterium]
MRNHAIAGGARAIPAAGNPPGLIDLVRLRADAPSLALFLLLSAFVLIPGLVLGPHTDAGIFATIGEQLTRGDLPYRDAWDHKPPGIYAVAAIAALLPGPTWPAFWAISVMFLAATGQVLQWIVGRPLAAVAVLAMGLYPAATGGGQTEAFAALPAAIAFLMASRQRWFVSGLAAGCALIFSFQLAPLLVALVVLAGARPRPILLGVGGVLVSCGAVVVLLAAVGILPAAFDALVTYDRIYLGSSRSGDLRSIHNLGVVLLPLAAALPFGARRVPDRSDLAAFAWCCAAAIFLALQGRLFAHYVIPLGIPLAVLARQPLQRKVARLAVVAATAVMVAVSFFVVVAEAPAHRGPPSATIGRWVRDHTQPSDTVLVWGLDSAVYVLADRAPAGRYPYHLPLLTPAYTTPALIAAWVADLAANPPAVIVDSEAANGYWADESDFLRAPPPGTEGGRTVDLLDPFRDWASARYAFVTEIDGRKIYLRQ